MKFFIHVCAVILCATQPFPAALGQSTTSHKQISPESPAFDVVSIRQIEPQKIVSAGSGAIAVGIPLKPCAYLKDRVVCDLPVKRIIEEAFQIKEFEIASGTLNSRNVYAIRATMPTETPTDTARLMLQQMLTQRFGLEFHREHRNILVYALLPSEVVPFVWTVFVVF